MKRGTKYGVTDEAFLPKMIEKCKDDEERGLVYILFYTGMHGSILSELTPDNIKRVGDASYLRWERTKTGRMMEARIPQASLPLIVSFVSSSRKKSIQWYNVLLKRIGHDAGFDDVSTLTFRHTRCINLIRDGMPLMTVAQLMGCTPDVVMRNYGRYSESQKRELI